MLYPKFLLLIKLIWVLFRSWTHLKTPKLHSFGFVIGNLQFISFIIYQIKQNGDVILGPLKFQKCTSIVLLIIIHNNLFVSSSVVVFIIVYLKLSQLLRNLFIFLIS